MVAGGETKVLKYYFGHNGRIAQRTKTVTEDEFIFIHTDHLGSAVRMTDMAGDPVQSIAYDPFGKTVYPAGSRSPAYQFTGQEFDAGIGLYYYGARYYDPELGRFIQADTVLDGLNRYAYCGNNPVMYVDPTGCTTNANDYYDSSWGYHMDYGDTITCSYTDDDGTYYTDTTIVGNSYGDGMYGPGGFETQTRREFSFTPDIPDVSGLNRPQNPEDNGEFPPLPEPELPAPKSVPDVTETITKTMVIAVTGPIGGYISDRTSIQKKVKEAVDFVVDNIDDFLKITTGLLKYYGGNMLINMGVSAGFGISAGSAGTLTPVGIGVSAVAVTAGTALSLSGVADIMAGINGIVQNAKGKSDGGVIKNMILLKAIEIILIK